MPYTELSYIFLVILLSSMTVNKIIIIKSMLLPGKNIYIFTDPNNK